MRYTVANFFSLPKNGDRYRLPYCYGRGGIDSLAVLVSPFGCHCVASSCAALYRADYSNRVGCFSELLLTFDNAHKLSTLRVCEFRSIIESQQNHSKISSTGLLNSTFGSNPRTVSRLLFSSPRNYLFSQQLSITDNKFLLYGV